MAIPKVQMSTDVTTKPWLHVCTCHMSASNFAATCASLLLILFAGLQYHGTLFVDFIHLRRRITVVLPYSSFQYPRSCIENLLPSMKATTLAHCSDLIGKCVVNIMEKHFVPPVLPAQNCSHDIMQNWPR